MIDPSSVCHQEGASARELRVRTFYWSWWASEVAMCTDNAPNLVAIHVHILRNKAAS